MTDINYNTNAPASANQKPVPAWVGLALVLVCLIGGIAFIWWVVRDPLSGGSDFIPDPNAVAAGRGGGGGRAVFRAPPNPDSVRKIADTPSNETYVAQSGGALMEIVAPKDGKPPRYVYRYARRDLFNQEQKDLMLMRFRVTQDDAVAQQIGLTDDQKAKLLKIGTNPPMELSQAEKDKLVGLWNAYHAAADNAKAGPEKALLAAVKETGDKNLDATRKKAAERIDQITKILTPEQIQKFKSMGNAP